MIRVYHPHGVALLAAIPGVFISSDQTPLVAFMANEKLANSYENVPQMEILMLMSACSIGAAMSSLFCGRICSYLGPLDTMRVASVFWVVGCVGTFCAGTNSQVVLWKLGKGVGLGLSSVASYLYIFEVLNSAERAMCVAWKVEMSVVAQECLYAVSLLLRARIGSPAAFHYAWLVEAFWGILLMGSTFFLPQSPKVLLDRGKWSSAQQTHAKLTKVRRSMSHKSVKSRPSIKSRTTVVSRATEYSRAVGPNLIETPVSDIPVPNEPVTTPAMSPGPDHTNPMHGWLKALLCMQLAQLLSLVVSPLFWQYLGSFCSLATSAVEISFHTQYALQLVFSAVPCIFLKTTSRTHSLALGLFLIAGAYTAMTVISFVYSSSTGLDPKPYQLSHTVRRFPASTILALTSFTVSIYSSLIAATLSLHCAESLSPNSRYKGLSVATSTAYASGALLNGFLLYFHAIRPPIVFTVVSILSVFSAVYFLYTSDTLGPSMQEIIPYSVPATTESVELQDNPTMEAEDEAQSEELRQKDSPQDIDDPFPRARDLADPVPPDTSLTPFQPLGHTQNFIRINKRGPFQHLKPSEARTVGTLATAKSQFTAPLVTAMTRLPDDRVSLHLSRSASTSTNKEENRGEFSELWTGPNEY